MQAIKTKFVGATNTRGARIVATCATARRVSAFDHELSDADNHRKAVRELTQALGWDIYCPYHGGELPDGSFVFVSSKATHLTVAA
jgi:hypothetical protein